MENNQINFWIEQTDLKVGGYLLEDNKKIASEFNFHFTSIADQLRSLLPQLNFDISKLQNFVIKRMDASITFSIPPITESKIIDCLKNLGRVSGHHGGKKQNF